MYRIIHIMLRPITCAILLIIVEHPSMHRVADKRDRTISRGDLSNDLESGSMHGNKRER